MWKRATLNQNKRHLRGKKSWETVEFLSDQKVQQILAVSELSLADSLIFDLATLIISVSRSSISFSLPDFSSESSMSISYSSFLPVLISTMLLWNSGHSTQFKKTVTTTSVSFPSALIILDLWEVTVNFA